MALHSKKKQQTKKIFQKNNRGHLAWLNGIEADNEVLKPLSLTQGLEGTIMRGMNSHSCRRCLWRLLFTVSYKQHCWQVRLVIV